MVVEMQENDNFQQPDWPTGLSFSLMSVHDDNNDDLPKTDDSAMVVLHDRLITDASISSSKDVAINPAHSHSCTNRLPHPNTDPSLLAGSSLINCKEHTSTYSITIDCRGEVEITEDPKSTKGSPSCCLRVPHN